MCLLSLATVSSAGRPVVGPVDGIFFRGAFHFGSAPDSIRFRHIAARPWVSATHLPGEQLSVTVHGRAERVDIGSGPFRQALLDIYTPRYGEEWGTTSSTRGRSMPASTPSGCTRSRWRRRRNERDARDDGVPAAGARRRLVADPGPGARPPRRGSRGAGVLLVGMGTSWHAAQHGAWMLRDGRRRGRRRARRRPRAVRAARSTREDGVIVLSHTAGTGYSMQVLERARAGRRRRRAHLRDRQRR